VGERCDPSGVHGRPERIGRERECHDPGPRPEKSLEVCEVEGRVVEDVDLPDDEVAIPRELEPWGDVGIVVEARDEDLVPGCERPADGAREREIAGGHVGTEDDLLRAAMKELGRAPAGIVDRVLDPPARLVRRADVPARVPVVRCDGGSHLVGDLGAAWGIEEHEPALQ
jgi:hypothetical protein